jgi:transcriptional regulator GlxA family with amidase domain
MDIAILLFENLTALDAVGPYEVLSRVPGARVTFVAAEPGLKRSNGGGLALLAETPLTELPRPEVVVVPGGPGQVEAMADESTLAWLRQVHETTRWTTSVCTGSLILARAGLLEGVRATSHWQALGALRALGADAVAERVVFEGRIVTAAGVSAGIDMALSLAARLAGDEVAQAIQLSIEYDPRPPFDAGSPATAPAAVVELLRSRSRFRTAS